jgi:hypothetical protein
LAHVAAQSKMLTLIYIILTLAFFLVYPCMAVSGRWLARNSVLVNNAREKLNPEVRDAAPLNRPDSCFSVHPISNS